MDDNDRPSRKGSKRVTFKLVSASASDPRTSANPWQRTLVLKHTPNAVMKKKESAKIPKELLDIISPADFGIHPNLVGPERESLIAEIYGSHEEYQKYAIKFGTYNESHKPTDEELDDDCYFPKDGYDYSKHLATITPQNFIPALNPDSITSSRFVAEVLKALDESEGDLEDIDDDFVAKAMDNDDPSTFVDDNELLWGGYKPMLPDVLGAFNKGNDCNLNISHSDDGEEAKEHIDYDDEIYDGDDQMLESLSAAYDYARWANKVDEKITMDSLDPDGTTKETVLMLAELTDENDTSDDDEFPDSSDESEQWDVETVLTKYTNVTNHPQRVLTNVVRRIKKAGLREPSEAQPKPIDDVEYIELPQVITTRKPNETPEEKRARKAAVKKAKALITRMKKENKEALKNVRKKVAEKSSVGSYDIMDGVKYLRLK
uniref:Protein LTV1 homolog n=1 Tax=Babesia bovis TaxID=5865 RepID=A7AQW3_BABBO|eukprot:XP_001610500.1 hypothetical protein [Babesia bovis T2Bo]